MKCKIIITSFKKLDYNIYKLVFPENSVSLVYQKCAPESFENSDNLFLQIIFVGINKFYA